MTRREREIEQGRLHLEASKRWLGVLIEFGKESPRKDDDADDDPSTLQRAVRDAFEEIHDSIRRDAMYSMLRETAFALGLISGPSPKRIRSRACRRVRMARKRRRGWA